MRRPDAGKRDVNTNRLVRRLPNYRGQMLDCTRGASPSQVVVRGHCHQMAFDGSIVVAGGTSCRHRQHVEFSERSLDVDQPSTRGAARLFSMGRRPVRLEGARLSGPMLAQARPNHITRPLADFLAQCLGTSALLNQLLPPRVTVVAGRD
jgi:hypothetical protein